MAERQILRSADGPTLAADVAEWLTAKAVAKPGRFAVCLSGGSTPQALYEKLATDAFKSRFPWERSYWFFGDDRFVPHDHHDSNYRMVREALFDHVPIPAANIYAVDGTGTPEQAARNYQEILRNFYGSQALDMSRPLFDVTFMGLGEDGHTASLFPGQSGVGRNRQLGGARHRPQRAAGPHHPHLPGFGLQQRHGLPRRGRQEEIRPAPHTRR